MIVADAPNSCVEKSGFEFDPLREATNYRNALLQMFHHCLQGRVLEVGAGIGQMTRLFQKQSSISELVAIEPDSRFCIQLRKFLPAQAVIEGTIKDLNDTKPWDAIVSINVLEHIQEDGQELIRYNKLLEPSKGRLCLFVPARPEIYSPLDAHSGHIRRYTLHELREKLERSGFRILKLEYFNLIGYFAWWMNFCILRRLSFTAQNVRFFDRFVFPMTFAFEQKMGSPFIGQSLIAIAEARHV